MGIVALFFWWVTAVVGLLIPMRWLPTRGNHASPRAEAPWSSGPGLSVWPMWAWSSASAYSPAPYLAWAM